MCIILLYYIEAFGRCTMGCSENLHSIPCRYIGHCAVFNNIIYDVYGTVLSRRALLLLYGRVVKSKNAYNIIVIRMVGHGPLRD